MIAHSIWQRLYVVANIMHTLPLAVYIKLHNVRRVVAVPTGTEHAAAHNTKQW